MQKSPNKKTEVCGSFAKKYEIRIALSKKKERKYQDLSEKQINWLKKFMGRSDMTYVNPEKWDHVYIGKFEEKSLYVQKQHLLWKLRDVLDIVNVNEIADIPNENLSFQDKFEKRLSFSMQYNFFKSHKECVWNRGIPEFLSLFEVCENACLIAKGDRQIIEN